MLIIAMYVKHCDSDVQFVFVNFIIFVLCYEFEFLLRILVFIFVFIISSIDD